MNRQEIRKVVKRMKPSSFEILWKKPYTQLESLIDVLESAAKDANQHPSMLCVDICSDGDRCTEKSATVILEAESLTDGSIVYNVYVH